MAGKIGATNAMLLYFHILRNIHRLDYQPYGKEYHNQNISLNHVSTNECLPEFSLNIRTRTRTNHLKNGCHSIDIDMGKRLPKLASSQVDLQCAVQITMKLSFFGHEYLTVLLSSSSGVIAKLTLVNGLRNPIHH